MFISRECQGFCGGITHGEQSVNATRRGFRDRDALCGCKVEHLASLARSCGRVLAWRSRCGVARERPRTALSRAFRGSSGDELSASSSPVGTPASSPAGSGNGTGSLTQESSELCASFFRLMDLFSTKRGQISTIYPDYRSTRPLGFAKFGRSRQFGFFAL